MVTIPEHVFENVLNEISDLSNRVTILESILIGFSMPTWQDKAKRGRKILAMKQLRDEENLTLTEARTKVNEFVDMLTFGDSYDCSE